MWSRGLMEYPSGARLDTQGEANAEDVAAPWFAVRNDGRIFIEITLRR
jgi:hypothetical protein